MSPTPFNGLSAPDEYNLCMQLGANAARSRLETHWNSWFTERDVIDLKNMGINAYASPHTYAAFQILRLISNVI